MIRRVTQYCPALRRRMFLGAMFGLAGLSGAHRAQAHAADE
ncbi:MAG TPA: hypothetical protein VGH36_02855 [Acetobacteraceae bacterium]|jgi:hypothetical protein